MIKFRATCKMLREMLVVPPVYIDGGEVPLSDISRYAVFRSYGEIHIVWGCHNIVIENRSYNGMTISILARGSKFDAECIFCANLRNTYVFVKTTIEPADDTLDYACIQSHDGIIHLRTLFGGVVSAYEDSRRTTHYYCVSHTRDEPISAVICDKNYARILVALLSVTVYAHIGAQN